MTTIAIENVTKTLKGHDVVKDASLSFASGHRYGLKGINGSGKTMLMRLMSGLIQPTAGTIRIDDNILGKDIDFPPSIGILIENPAFLDYLSAFDNLRFLADIQKKVTDKQIRDCIRLVGLDPDSKKKFGKFSLGMKQRLGIAGAIVEDPDIVLLDEPTNALDSSGVELVTAIVADLKARGKLVVLSCHDADLLRTMSDEIYFIEDGRIVNRVDVNEQGNLT